MRTITLTSKNQITLPAELVRQLGLNRTRKLLVQRRGDMLLLTIQKDLSTQLGDIQRRAKPYIKQSFSDAQLAAGREQAWLSRHRASGKKTFR